MSVENFRVKSASNDTTVLIQYQWCFSQRNKKKKRECIALVRSSPLHLRSFLNHFSQNCRCFQNIKSKSTYFDIIDTIYLKEHCRPMGCLGSSLLHFFLSVSLLISLITIILWNPVDRIYPIAVCAWNNSFEFLLHSFFIFQPPSDGFTIIFLVGFFIRSRWTPEFDLWLIKSIGWYSFRSSQRVVWWQWCSSHECPHPTHGSYERWDAEALDWKLGCQHSDEPLWLRWLPLGAWDCGRRHFGSSHGFWSVPQSSSCSTDRSCWNMGTKRCWWWTDPIHHTRFQTVGSPFQAFHGWCSKDDRHPSTCQRHYAVHPSWNEGQESWNSRIGHRWLEGLLQWWLGQSWFESILARGDQL